ncbi:MULTISPECIES: M24 family metallopeptidase [Dysgonomonas]|uniref:M24 family metallopeptidase n=1 Tax=Dysgonomonas TaxID=156973 RepID=UPI000928937F|nr:MULTISPECIES: Xaa-Pro peptidase family protein [Dysgonomonas]MBN9303133.1 aminopeptidase P family protein [Dysgonomonas mossii]OJX65320.1 MAG: peptidase M24 [Dysgonomonas sp. 37-18]
MSYKEDLSKDLLIRQQRLQSAMQSMNIEGCILTTAVNVFYMTGMVYNGYYYLPIEGQPVHFVKRPEDVSFDNTIYIRKPEQITDELKNLGRSIPQSVLIETDVISFGECSRLLNTFGLKEAANASALMRKVRSVKTEFELEQVRLCARKHEAVYKMIPSVYKDGMTDIEFQIEIERLMRLHGSLGLFRSYGENMDIYMGSLLTGENAEAPSPFDFALGGAGTSPILPLGASGQKIKKGNTIMVDMAGNYTPWMTDMTRVFSVGKTLDLAYRAHQVSIEISNKVMDIAKSGVSCAELYNIAMEAVVKNNLEPYFMGTKQQAKFVGHGVGLEINEPPVLTPRSKELLEPNIVFALEPKFVIPEVGAVGIENTYLVTQDGLEKLTILEEEIIEL